MKKLIPILLILAAGTVWAQNSNNEFIGKWSAEPFVIEQEDGLLVAPEAVYSYPYLGITGIDFIDRNFIVFTVYDSEYRAFYEIESLDFDNYHVNCVFKNGEEFSLKLVRADIGWKYFYRIAEDSILKGQPPEPEAEETGMDEEVVDDESGAVEIVESVYAGILRIQGAE